MLDCILWPDGQKLLIIKEDLAAIRPNGAGNAFDQRGLSRSVFSHQCVHLALFQRKAHVIQCLYARVRFADALKPQDIVMIWQRSSPFPQFFQRIAPRCVYLLWEGIKAPAPSGGL